ncbi:MAG: ABC transporter substrate-binding protein, partial [Acidimicrobiales bacterium]
MRGLDSTAWRRWIAALLVLGLAASACSGDDSDDGASDPTDSTEEDTTEPVRGGTLVYAVEADTSQPWDPTAMLCAAACHSTVGRTIFEPLAMVGDDGEVVPYLLETITPNDDATVFTLKLREGIRFHDGTELTADVVAFNMERQREGLLVGPYVRLISGVESDGAYTVTVTLSDSWSDFPYALNSQFGYVGSQEWELASDSDPSLKTQPVGTGPFKFTSYESGENGNLKAERFEDYWRGDGEASLTDEGLPYLDGIEVRFMPSGQARTDALKAGDIDLLQTSSGLEIDDLESAEGIVSDVLDEPIL